MTTINRLDANIGKGLEYAGELERIDGRIVALQKELMAIARVHVRGGIDGGVYSDEQRQVAGELERLRGRRQAVKEQELRSLRLREHLKEFAALTETVDGFDEGLFVRLVERVVVGSGGRLVFGFKTGVEVRGRIP